jgi:hypothetical protein
MISLTPTGPTTPENIDDRIDAWHDGGGRNLELHEYLGWTREQYKAWLERSEYPTEKG